ncbi:hypothetical protein EZV62_002173 [Acer yangbiense]|uniref:Reverse transcriptase Ty1/copia-type domain-containing protein n=1 Tax=Acer yangbiense TaxID=1000413 RepID=A0A5C7IXE7_9ROSI|nr:hypothetical protein EZV62_002173 [Acer yangbiense]
MYAWYLPASDDLPNLDPTILPWDTFAAALNLIIVIAVKSGFIILLLYVNDMLVAGADLEEINNLKKQLSSEFEIKDLGIAKQILGTRIIRDEHRGYFTAISSRVCSQGVIKTQHGRCKAN